MTFRALAAPCAVCTRTTHPESICVHIVHVLDRTDAVGGVQTYLADLIPALAARGHLSSIVSETSGDLGGATTSCVPGIAGDGPQLPASVRKAFDKVLADQQADLVIQHVAVSPSVAVAAAERTSVVVYAHDYFMTCPGNARYLHKSENFCIEGHGLRCFRRAYTERSTNRRPDRLVRAYRRTQAWQEAWPVLTRVLVASRFVEGVHLRSGIPKDLLRVVGYPVEKAIAIEADPAAPDVLYVGRLVDSKGVHVLLEALARLSGVSAAVAGDGPARAELEELSRDLGLTDRVRFLGWIGQEQRAALLRGSRVFVLPSLWDEPFGIVGVEALGAGLPVVATAAGGIPDWLDDGVTGILVPRGDRDTLARALDRLLQDEPLRRRYASAGPIASERFSLARHLDVLLPALGLE
jgi:glycosyltransferase involved in cell wall biosynthesis